MKFNCGPTLGERRRLKRERLAQWHDWFAWFPVRLGPGDCRWLETIERRSTYYDDYVGRWWQHSYRAKEST